MQDKRVRVRLDPDVLKEVRRRAKTNFRSISKEVSQQLRAYFETQTKPTCTSSP